MSSLQGTGLESSVVQYPNVHLNPFGVSSCQIDALGGAGPSDPNPRVIIYQATHAMTTTTVTKRTKRIVQVLRECLLGFVDWLVGAWAVVIS
jgi:hypothetical protein